MAAREGYHRRVAAHQRLLRRLFSGENMRVRRIYDVFGSRLTGSEAVFLTVSRTEPSRIFMVSVIASP